MKEETKKTNFGIICESLNIYEWQLNTIKKINSTEALSLKTIILAGKENKNRKVLTKLKNIKYVLWEIYYLLFVKIFVKELKLKKITNFFPDADIITIKAHETGKNQIQALREKHDMLFILNLCTKIDQYEKLIRAQDYIVSVFQHNENKIYFQPDSFWHMYFNSEKTEISVIRDYDNNKGIIIKKGIYKTIRISYLLNLKKNLHEKSMLLYHACIDLLNNSCIEKYTLFKGEIISQKPGNLQFIKFFISVVISLLNYVYKRGLFVDRWNIGIVNAPPYKFLSKNFKPSVIWIKNTNKKKLMADPFIIDVNNNIHLFYEELNFRNGKGFISTALYDEGKKLKSIPIMKDKHHFSYPFIIKEGKDFYCIPEESEKNEINIYKAVEFPSKWEYMKTLMHNFPGLDSSFIFFNNMWWMFTSNRTTGKHDKLYIFYSDSLHGEWYPHKKNPVKIDISNSRSAGSPFIHEGNLYRPAQDYSRKLQWRININKITKLTQDEFEENHVVSVNPIINSPFPDKIHTINNINDITVIDGSKEEFIFKKPEYVIFKIKMTINAMIK